MIYLNIAFWIALACVVYAYAAYPLFLGIAARLRPKLRRTGEPFRGSVSLVVAAYNEEMRIGTRLRELIGHLERCQVRAEIIVVSDGSADATAEVARRKGNGLVRVLELSANQGKAAAISACCAEARNDVIVFADVRQTWAPDALQLLLENFNDPSVGAVSGDLVVESTPGVMTGVGLYWRYEKWLRKQESRLHSTVGVTGAISAVRRDLFRAIPPGTILDDVYWPLHVAMQRKRVLHDGRAKAFDRLPDRARDEYRRKIRTLTGNFQLLTRLPAAFLPWRNPVWFQLMSHKLCRLLVPWALAVLFICGLEQAHGICRFVFWLEITAGTLGLAGLINWIGTRSRVAAAAASFLVLNTAAWLAFWVWASGRASRSWSKVSYEVAPLSYSTNP
jgi:biofilm PGA synthesis N-glycosyltransferase PgaC